MRRLRAVRRVLSRVGVACCVMLALSGCEGIYGMQLPGGAATGDDAYRVKVQFTDVLDLVPQASVKVNDVTVGSVESIKLDGYTAVVTARLERRVKLPDNAVADIRQTSLLGEKFVALAAPPGAAPVGRLSDGDVIPLSRSGRNVEVEEVLAAVSLLLNGGGIEQLQTINREIGLALQGREPELRSLLTQLNTFVGGLDQQKADIIRALEGLDRLASTLNAQRKVIEDALDRIGPGLKVIADQRVQLTQMLTALSRLGEVGTRVIQASKDDTVANLRALQPILEQLVAAGTNLPRGLELLVSYPFPRNVTSAIFQLPDGRYYTNLHARLDLNLTTVLTNLFGGTLPTLPPLPGGGTPPTVPGVPPLPDAPAVPTPPTVPGVPTPPLPGITPTAPGVGPTGSGNPVDLLIGGLGG